MKSIDLLLKLVALVIFLAACRSNPTSTPTVPTPTATLIPPTSTPIIVDLVETLVTRGNYTKFIEAIELAELADKLRNQGPFTLFVPSDEMFEALPEGTLSDEDLFIDMLFYHVLADEVTRTELSAGTSWTTLLGEDLSITVDENQIQISGPLTKAQIIQADVEASNGLIHFIDAVLIPPPFEDEADAVPVDSVQLPDIIDTAIAVGQFETFVAGLEAAQLIDTLRGVGPFTVFAPTNEAFIQLVEKASEDLMIQLDEEPSPVLLYHVLPEILTSDNIFDGQESETLEGATILFQVDGDQVILNSTSITSAEVISPNIETVNGIIHMIDGVILPPDLDQEITPEDASPNQDEAKTDASSEESASESDSQEKTSE